MMERRIVVLSLHPSLHRRSQIALFKAVSLCVCVLFSSLAIVQSPAELMCVDAARLSATQCNQDNRLENPLTKPFATSVFNLVNYS